MLRISPRFGLPRLMPILPNALWLRRSHLSPSWKAPVILRQKLKRMSNCFILIRDNAFFKGSGKLHGNGFLFPYGAHEAPP